MTPSITPTITTTTTRTPTPTVTRTPVTPTPTPTTTVTPSFLPTSLVLFLDASNPVSYPLSGGTTWFDLSSRKNNGTLGTGVTYNSANGGSIVISGSPRIPVSFTNPTGIPSGNSSYATNFWVKFNSSGQTSAYCAWGQDQSTWKINVFRYTNANPNIIQNYWWAGADDFNTTFTPTNNQWYNIVYSYNGSVCTLYINGVLTSTKTLAAQLTITVTDNFRLGSDLFAGGSVMNGNIAVAQVYNTTLTQSQVTSFFDATKGKFGYT